MVNIYPFAAIRPAPGYEERIAALPYDVYSGREAREAVQKNPLSFLGIDRAETQFGPEIGPYEDCVYKKAGELLAERRKTGYFVQDPEPYYYIYELTMDGRIQTGIGAVFCVDDYLDGKVVRHENTREDKEEDRIRHVRACNAQTGPVFLAYREREEISLLVGQYKKEAPLYDFYAEDGVRHRLWRVEDKGVASQLYDAFGKVERLYIADGHHRCSAAVKTALSLRSQKAGRTGSEAWNYVLAVCFPDKELRIWDYNRAVVDLNGMTEANFLVRLREEFLVEFVGEEAVSPGEQGEFGMYLKTGWYRLKARKREQLQDPVKRLDVSILQDSLLSPILGIQDPRRDGRIRFIGGIRGLQALEACVKEGMAVAFCLYPTSMAELFTVADAGRLMPPKSTWFEPKLRSGLLLHALS